MKRTLFAVSCFFVAACLHAELLWFDSMNYPAGLITNAPNSPWIQHSGSADGFVVNYPGSAAAMTGPRYEVNQTRTADVHRWFYPGTTNGFAANSGTVYVSFIMSLTNLPANAGGTYFAHLMDTGTSFRGRIFNLVPPNPYPYTSTVPGVFRIGLANAAGDFSNGNGGPNVQVPIDLALQTDYQVVMKYDFNLTAATVWVNPSSENETANSSSATGDLGAVTNAMAALAFRQANGEGAILIRDVAVGTSFADVVTNAAATPVIGLQPAGVTNFAGNPAIIEIAASGMGELNYQWYHNGSALSGATGQSYIFSSLQGSEAGEYYCAVSNPAGSTNSATAYVSVNTTPAAPAFTTQPTSRTNSLGDSIVFSGLAVGTGPLSYQWNLNGTPLTDGPSTLPGDPSVISGSQSPFLNISNVSTNEAGVYTVTVTGGGGSATSQDAVLTILGPRAVTIAFVRSLLDKSTWQTTDTKTLFSITGVITTFTNLTSGSTSSSYIQDDTGGLNLFVTGTGANAFRPQRGDIVTANGTLVSYNNGLELQCQTSSPFQTYTVVGHTNLPAPFVFAPILTNNAGLMETNLEGRLALLTNVFFPGTKFTSGNIVVTNAEGSPFIVFVSAQCTNIVGQPMPQFAWSVSGTLAQYKSGTYSKAGYELNLTSLDDLATDPPSAPVVTPTRSADELVLSWTAVPYRYSYSILAATDVTGPYLPIATGLTFTDPTGKWSEVTGAQSPKFYKVVSP